MGSAEEERLSISTSSRRSTAAATSARAQSRPRAPRGGSRAALCAGLYRYAPPSAPVSPTVPPSAPVSPDTRRSLHAPPSAPVFSGTQRPPRRSLPVRAALRAGHSRYSSPSELVSSGTRRRAAVLRAGLSLHSALRAGLSLRAALHASLFRYAPPSAPVSHCAPHSARSM